MTLRPQRIQDADLKRLSRIKSPMRKSPDRLGPQMLEFFKHSVQKRQTKFTKIAEYWSLLVPPLLGDHCALESFTRGSLVVMVDSSSHLYELKQLLLAGLQKQLLLSCKSAGLRKLTLKPGTWYDSSPGGPTPRFER